MVGLIIVLVLGAVLAVQHPDVQERIGGKLLEKLDGKFGGKVTVGSAFVDVSGAVILTDVLLTDDSPLVLEREGWNPADTIFFARKITATTSLRTLLGGISLRPARAGKLSPSEAASEPAAEGASEPAAEPAEKPEAKRGLAAEGLHLGRVSIEDAVFNLVVEPDSIRRNNLARVFGFPPPKDVPVEKGNVFDASKVRCTNVRYTMQNGKKEIPYGGVGINWGDMDLTVSRLRAHNMRFAKSRMSFVIDDIGCTEKSGYVAERITGRAKVGMGKTEVSNLRLVDAWSDFRAAQYTMNYRNAKAFRKFTSDVRLGLKLGRGTLAAKTLSAFTGAFGETNPSVLAIEGGKAGGYINDLCVEQLRFTETESGVNGTLSGRVTGLTQSKDLLLDATLRGWSLTGAGIDRLARNFAGVDPGISKKIPGRTFRLDADASGSLNALGVKADLGSRDGSLGVDLKLDNLLEAAAATGIAGSFQTKDLNIGKFAGVAALGPCTSKAGFRATLGKAGKAEGGTGAKKAKAAPAASVILDSLRVSKLSLLGYDYSNIAAAGRFDGSVFDGKLVCDDPSLNFLFQGIVDLGKKDDALYRFYANLGYADLEALNIDPRGTSKVSAQVFANFTRTGRNDLLGEIDVLGLSVEDPYGIKDVGNVELASHSTDGLHSIRFRSSFADASYEGSKAIVELIKDIQALTTARDLPALYKKGAQLPKSAGTSSVTMDFHDSWDILSYLLPGMYIADSTAVRMSVDRRGVVKGRLTSPRLAFKGNYMKGLDLNFDNLDRSLNCILLSKETSLAGLGLKNSALTAYAEDNAFALGFHYDNAEGKDNYGELYLTGNLSRDETDTLVVAAKPLYSYMKFDGKQWDIAESDLRYRAGELKVDRFSIRNKEQMLSVSGGFSARRPDTLDVIIDNIDLAAAGRLLPKNLDLGGKVTGTFSLISPVTDASGMEADLLCEEVSISGAPLGTIELAAAWDEPTGQYNVGLVGRDADTEMIDANGYFSPTDRSIDATATLRNFNLAAASPFLANVFSEIGGSISGVFTASGPLDSLSVGSTGAALEGARLKVALTGVPYTADGPFYIDESGLYLENIAITDSKGGLGALGGSIEFDEEIGAFADIDLDFDNFELLSKEYAQGSSFYGTLFATGNVHVGGPFDELTIEVDATSSDVSKVHVPLSGSAVSSKSGLLSFREREKTVYEDPYEARMKKMIKEAKAGGNDLMIKAKVTATPDLEALLEIDRTTGNVINASGMGTVNLEIKPSSDVFTIDGDYNITDGSYHFNALGIANRDFKIKEGSSIKFKGEPQDSELDVDAVYTLKTSLSTLLSDTTSVATRRTVECGINISDKLTNPKLGFSINIPDLDPTTKSQVEGALNTEDKIQKQFVALLLTNTFLPDEQSGIASNNSNILLSNVGEIMSNQLNNILQKLDIPLDFGLGYQQNEGGTDIFDVAVSTQLFNNRVVVNGTIGNRQYSTSTNPNGDVVGDLDIEVKLDRSGKFRLNLFSHSADEYTNYLDYSQRNGMGIAYQKEYNRFGEFIRGIFRRKKADAEADIPKKEDEELVKIEIER